MKKVLSIALLSLLPVVFTACVQRKVTEFLGIPVDGSKREMIDKLKEKEFYSGVTFDYLEGGYDLLGEFNGEKVYVRIILNKNNNKVCRVCVIDQKKCDGEQIIKRYKELVRKFRNNKKYKEDFVELPIYPESENIFYNYEEYRAGFLQLPDDNDLRNRSVWFKILKVEEKKYGIYGLREEIGYRIAIFYDNEFNRKNGEDL